MLRTEIIHTCTNEAVAEAASRSLGKDFLARISLLAGAHGLTPGVYAAALVRQFAEEADEDDWCALGIAIARRDMPVLAGFRFILETMIDGASKPARHAKTPRGVMRTASSASAGNRL